MDITDVRDGLATSLGAAYQLDRELGDVRDGQISRVFLAHETFLGRDVVVKVLAYPMAEGLSTERFAREIRLAARLQHAHIVPLLAAGMTGDGLPFYTMPYVRGESLRARLARGRLSVDEGVGILRDVLGALAYAHAHGVVHRDIKPENVLLSSDTAVVIDFGIAKALQASMTGPPAGPAGHDAVTGAGVLSPGTPAYMAPEQSAGDPAADHRVDLYAWGVVAYEVLAGRHPFAGWISLRQLLTAHLTAVPAPLGDVAADVSPALVDVVMRCLAKDPAERPASANAVCAALDDAPDGAVRGAGPGRKAVAGAFALYAGAVVAVTLLTRAAIHTLGLPEWVSTGALVVMALGLPVLVAMGLQHRHPRR